MLLHCKYLISFSLAREIRENLRRDVTKIKASLNTFQPGLAIVQVGDREDSNVYIRMKIKAATEIGIKVEHIRMPKSTTEYEVWTFSFLFFIKCNNLNDPKSNLFH